MNTEVKTLNSPRFNFDKENPFNGDLFKRRELAKQLTGYLDRLREGAVLSLDAQWGEGKTWFGLNWAADLKNNDYRVIYLDAFQQDYVEDPFLLIASEINDVIGSDDSVAEDLKEKAAKVMKAILPLSAKVIINVASRLLLGSEDGSKVIQDATQSATDSAAEATQKWLEDKVENHKKEKESLEEFRQALRSYCESQEKPVVFFIDELDRCKPTFAIKLIERLKHFFDVPNLIFILLLNNQQLENAVKGVYGSDTDAASYLRKFVHLNLKLPKNTDFVRESSNANWIYLNKLKEHYKFQNTQSINQFIDMFSIFSSLLNMTLRDLERGMALLVLSGVNNSLLYMAWPITLKLKRLDIYNELLKGDIKAHFKAIELLETLKTSEDINFWNKRYFLAYHIIEAQGREKLTEEQAKDYDKLKPMHGNKDHLLTMLKRIDLYQTD